MEGEVDKKFSYATLKIKFIYTQSHKSKWLLALRSKSDISCETYI